MSSPLFFRFLVAIIILVFGCSSETPQSQSKEEYLKKRDQLRAFSGAPPVVPHPIKELGRQECLSCHWQGLDTGNGKFAAKTPHPELKNCQQCHVAANFDIKLYKENVFKGKTEPRPITRLYPGAPPIIPHDRNMRENCLACHGPKSKQPFKTSHSERVNCLQCHVYQENVNP